MAIHLFLLTHYIFHHLNKKYIYYILLKYVIFHYSYDLVKHFPLFLYHNFNLWFIFSNFFQKIFSIFYYVISFMPIKIYFLLLLLIKKPKTFNHRLAVELEI